MPVRSIALAALIVALVVPLGGCQQAKTVLAPEPVVVTEEATVAVPAAPVQGELPESTPEGLPLWPESTVVSAEADKDGAFSLVTETNEPFEGVVKGVGVGFERAGWTVTESASEEGIEVLAVAGEGVEGIVTVTDTGEAVTIEYFLTPLAS